MTGLLQPVLDLAADGLFAAFIVFLRVGAAMAALPAFGEQSLPQRVRLAMAIAFTAVVYPAVALEVQPVVAAGGLIAPYLLTEPLAGLAFGLVLRLFVLVLQMAGAIAAQATSLSQLFAGSGAEPQAAMGHLLTVGGLALAVMAGLHVRLAEALILSYQALPAGVFPAAADILGWGLGNVARAFALAFSLAAPFVIASLIYNVALGVINRAMPQLMVAFVGAPALTAGGLVLLALALPSGLVLWHAQFQVFLAAPFDVPP
ncbi:flagellar biosynthetic protein FliR [Frigidibacter mobilis]|uniref:Flagellar biosynthetic protein FliR n=1 Tax=Frigidibacter mobilis TaxID=1335048 RepID=A0A159Z227_9RHOB|nr:flagellar biosynthetic protein FliR [Frigidibacter mobilis]AMY68040.1 flagellar biosynthetic protein FliR [Frigidibacter mobilis]